MERGTTAIKADIKCVERSLMIDTGSDVSIYIRDTTLRPYGVTGETLEVKGRQTHSV